MEYVYAKITFKCTKCKTLAIFLLKLRKRIHTSALRHAHPHVRTQAFPRCGVVGVSIITTKRKLMMADIKGECAPRLRVLLKHWL